MFVDYCEKHRGIGLAGIPDSTALGMFLRKACPEVRKERRTVNDCRKRFYIFPPLARCRQLFDASAKQPFVWELDDDEVGPKVGQKVGRTSPRLATKVGHKAKQ